MFKTREQIVETLKRNKIHPTPNRVLIAEIILNATNHPSTDEIHLTLTKRGKNISFTSVYNIIKVLQKANLIKELKYSERSRFDPNLKPHSHFICEICGKVYDVDGEQNISVPNEIMGMKVNEVEVIYRGICNNCKSN
ncbi:transcriptional repressor [Tepiditoga spiralis]|uniref:Transcriptional repressor n=1 Tax=Tepiditoga spiralis TaxID=2108365 RepID=A0A7G1G8S2_9BACT|nr:Fur family transcriptional regulator [Tepiditoga spiralis]BBE31367.1 transcriptional repressor [Tepiditoga spiralis]